MKITFFNSSKKKNQQSSEDVESKGGRKEEMVKIFSGKSRARISFLCLSLI
jgi:hypothetical protein